MTELTPEKLFEIIGHQTVELAVLKGQLQTLASTNASLQKEIESFNETPTEVVEE